MSGGERGNRLVRLCGESVKKGCQERNDVSLLVLTLCFCCICPSFHSILQIVWRQAAGGGAEIRNHV
jgi:hypothetical protein